MLERVINFLSKSNVIGISSIIIVGILIFAVYIVFMVKKIYDNIDDDED